MSPRPLVLRFTLLALLGVGNCSPTAQDWTSLNQTLQGRLQALTPLALPCFSQYNGNRIEVQQAACDEVQENYTTAAYRVDQVSAYTFTQDETCISDGSSQQCLLDSTDPQNPAAFTNVSCQQGALPSYYVQVREPSDVADAFKFASSTKATIAIKNSGHDYNGRSSGPGSLSLWTRKLQNLTYHASFVPSECDGQAGVSAITTGAGINFDQAYSFANANNATIVGGSGPTVGASGGWLQTAGHGVLSRVYGLGVDRVLQFEIVTPDGQLRTANSCQNQDLFWALRGGGGGTFGVVLSSTHRVEPTIPLSVSFFSLPPNSSAEIQDTVLDIIVNNTLKWANDGWGGFQSSTVGVVATPLLSLSQAQSCMSDLVTYVSDNGGTALVESLPSWYAFYQKYVTSNPEAVGSTLFNHNWLLPSSLFETASSRTKIREYMDWMTSVDLPVQVLATTPYLYSGNGSTKVEANAYGSPNSTSTTPAWRDSAMEIVTTKGWAWNASIAEKKKFANLLVQASDKAAALAPQGGSYANEAHPWIKDWENAFWGDNYAELVAAKKKWDPEGLLGCLHCVGSSENEVVGGKCLGSLI
ncbi:MAG: hypothetical protein M1820_004117 [Bogoriella megaspora]|nr:MAG: hypothetical protein M1820_004117 [Bogoriella megaspora]